MSLSVLLVLIISVLSTLAFPMDDPQPRDAALAQVYSSCVLPRTVALTFDDGPYIYLQDILKTLSDANAVGTFFFNGNNYDCIYDEDNVQNVKDVVAQGHLIGAHTWSHADLTTLSSDQIDEQMNRIEVALNLIAGVKPAFTRPPYGNYNDQVRQIAYQRGQSLVMWDQDTGDSVGKSVSESKAVYDDAIASGVNNMLVLNHEVYETTAHDVLPYAIRKLQSAGYKLVGLDDCLGVSGYKSVGGPSVRDDSWTCDGTPAPSGGGDSS